jgi:hypothetical protein
MLNHTQQFSEAIKAAGLIPPEAIEPGKLHRMPGAGKAGSNSAAWCKLFDDGIGGVFGDFSSGFESSWQAEREAKYSEAEIAAFKVRIAEERKQREADEAQRKAGSPDQGGGDLAEGRPRPRRSSVSDPQRHQGQRREAGTTARWSFPCRKMARFTRCNSSGRMAVRNSCRRQG